LFPAIPDRHDIQRDQSLSGVFSVEVCQPPIVTARIVESPCGQQWYDSGTIHYYPDRAINTNREAEITGRDDK
jgi:hypothetical protein